MSNAAEPLAAAPAATAIAAPADAVRMRTAAAHGLMLLVLTSACAQLDVAIVPYLAPYIQRDLGVSDVELSMLIGGAFGLFYTVVGIPVAGLIDRHSRRAILAFGMITWTVGAMLCGVAQNFAQLFVARFIVGGGEAVNGPTAYSLMGDLFPRERLPRAIAIYHIGQVSGPAIAMLISAVLMTLVIGMPPIPLPFGRIEGWQLVFMLTGCPGFFIAAAMLTTMREPPRRIISNQMAGAAGGRDGEGWIRDYVEAIRYMVLRRRVFAPIFLALLVSALSFGAVAWMPIFFQRTYGWAPAELALWQSIISLVLVPLGMAASVVLAERFTARQRDDAPVLVFIIGRVIGLAGILAPLMPTPALALGMNAVSGFALGLTGPIQNVQMQSVTPAEVRGKITALYLFLLNVVGIALSPILVAMLTDYVFRDPQQIRWSLFVLLGFSAPLTLACACWSRKPFVEEVQRLKALEAAAR